MIIKQLLIYFWKTLQWTQVLFRFSRTNKDKDYFKIYYGGAVSGNYGGPRVKIKRMKMFFPQYFGNFNLIYLLSNSLYVTPKFINYFKKKNIPIVLNQNGVFFPGWYLNDWKSMNSLMSFYYHRADYVFYQSKFCKKSANHFLGKRKGNGEILYNAVDTNFFKPRDSRKKNKTFTFLITGKITFDLSYRVEYSILGLNYALNKGLNAKLIIAGKCDNKTVKKNLLIAKELDLLNNIKFVGPYKQEQAVNIYQMADAYIMMKYLDPCPNSVIEALSCGLPVLYSSSGGTPELVDSKSGVGLKVKESWDEMNVTPTPKQIGEGMLKVYKKHKFFRYNARKAAIKNFDIKNWIKKHESIFEKLLKNA